MKKGLSFIIYSKFGTFRKPDQSIDSYLTFDYIPIPSLLGMLGALVGLKGYHNYQKLMKLEYLEKLSKLNIGIEPLVINTKYPCQSRDFAMRCSNIPKTTVTYNNLHGYGSMEGDGNWMITEQILLNPAYRVYILPGGCDKHIFFNLTEAISKRNHYYNIFMGKNEFPITLINEEDIIFEEPEQDLEDIQISSIFSSSIVDSVSPGDDSSPFLNMSWIPIKMVQGRYQYEKIIFGNYDITIKSREEFENKNFLLLKKSGDDEYVFFF